MRVKEGNNFVLSLGNVPHTYAAAYVRAESEANRLADFADRLLRESELSEQAGFDGLFVPPHHARTERMFPSPLTLLTGIAARNQWANIGSFVMAPPMYDPVRFAEQPAMNDIMSRGRLILGLSVGYDPEYFNYLGVLIRQREGRFEKVTEVMQKACTTKGPATSQGKCYNYEAIHLTPKPHKKPPPPIWIGAFGHQSIARGDRLGQVWDIAPVFDTIDDLKAASESYSETALKAGKTPHIALLRDGRLASSMGEAKDTFGPLWV